MFRSFLTLFFSITIFGLQAQSPASGILKRIQGLDKMQRFLYLAAHPDDENTRVIAWLNNDKQMQTAYLSLTRGDGGQNLIGSELGAELGLIRTHELLQARSIDGGNQFFTRAVDFGYSKTADETFRKWGKDPILSDVVRVIRTFRPDVIITRFPPDERAGHGHHTASAMLAIEAMKLAGDPEAFPEQLEQGLVPWSPRSVYWNASVWWNPKLDSLAETDPKYLAYDIGGYDPLLGWSYNELGSIARSQHKSQGFGVMVDRGSTKEYFYHLAGDRLDDGFFFDQEGMRQDQEWDPKWSEILRSIEKNFSVEHPERSVSSLIALRKQLGQWKNERWASIKIKELDKIILDCLGIYMEAVSTDYSVVKGEEISIRYRILKRDNTIKVGLNRVRVNDALTPEQMDMVLPFNEFKEVELKFRVDLPISSPYWLRNPYNELFQVDDPRDIGKPVLHPDIMVKGYLRIEGEIIPFEVPVEYKWSDRVKGEQRRSTIVTPGATVSFLDPMKVFPDQDTRKVKVEVRAFMNEFSGNLGLKVPEGWVVTPDLIPVDIPRKGEIKTFAFEVKPPKGSTVADIRAVWMDPEVPARALSEINYDHFPHQSLFPYSTCKLVRVETDMDLNPVGYIAGAGDEVAEALRQLGYPVTMITESDFLQTDLSRFSTIITGIRAFNVHEWLRAGKGRLMDYVKNGGNLIVQYNTSGRWESSMEVGPYPFKISRERVTEEDAEVRFIDPKHRLLNDPNKITQEDFSGWVQERGLYFADEWDPSYSPVISWHDTDEPARLGGVLVAEYGKGTYIYTGISFFRQLPSGVPGAYRLLINMISYE